jgi:hypothetical protein
MKARLWLASKAWRIARRLTPNTGTTNVYESETKTTVGIHPGVSWKVAK